MKTKKLLNGKQCLLIISLLTSCAPAEFEAQSDYVEKPASVLVLEQKIIPENSPYLCQEELSPKKYK